MQFADAISVIRQTALAHLAETETISIGEISGRVCAASVASELTIPPFTNSGVDGYAVRSSELSCADKNHPFTFDLAGTIFPGETPQTFTPANSVWAIMTGAPVPLDFDACVKIEETSRKGSVVSIQTSVQANDHLRFAGTDFDKGTPVVSIGERLRPEHAMALASVGFASVKVFKKTKVLLLSTGKELVEPGEPLSPGEIYNSTRAYLKSTLEALGCEVEIGPTMADEPSAFIEFMKSTFANPPDILVTTGAVSMGEADFVKPALLDLGAEILFHKISIRPGKPILFSRFKKNAQVAKDFVIFGLPGNPVSGVIGARFFIETYLRTRTSQSLEKPFQARLAGDVSKPKDLRCFMKAQLTINDGEARVQMMKGQPSYMVRPLLQSSVWAVLPEGEEKFMENALVDVFMQDSRGEFL